MALDHTCLIKDSLAVIVLSKKQTSAKIRLHHLKYFAITTIFSGKATLFHLHPCLCYYGPQLHDYAVF